MAHPDQLASVRAFLGTLGILLAGGLPPALIVSDWTWLVAVLPGLWCVVGAWAIRRWDLGILAAMILHQAGIALTITVPGAWTGLDQVLAAAKPHPWSMVGGAAFALPAIAGALAGWWRG